MPIYEYRCKGGHVEERLFLNGSPAFGLVCSRCGEPAERIMSLPAPPRFRLVIVDSKNPPEVKKEWDNKFGKMYSMDFGADEKRGLETKAEMQGIYDD